MQAFHRTLPEKRTYYFHVHPAGKWRAVTVAIVAAGDFMAAGTARCSVGDNFNRREGRRLAAARAEKVFGKVAKKFADAGEVVVPNPGMDKADQFQCARELASMTLKQLGLHWGRSFTL